MRHAEALSSCRYETEIARSTYDRSWRLVQWVGRGKDVLELGCSTGYITRHLAEQECRVVGVELDSAAASRAERFCDRVLVADLADPTWMSALSSHSFDVVLMGDVLEHLADPGAVLREVRPLLRSSGSVVISLPNVVHWITRFEILFGRFEYVAFGTLDQTHLRFFTRKSAQELIEQAGYRITRFHPAIGGRMSGHLRPVWQRLANIFPGLFAYQLLFQASA